MVRTFSLDKKAGLLVLLLLFISVRPILDDCRFVEVDGLIQYDPDWEERKTRVCPSVPTRKSMGV